MPAVSPQSRAALADLHFVAERVKRVTYNESASRTAVSRWENYIKFCDTMKISDYQLAFFSQQEQNDIILYYSIWMTLGNTINHQFVKWDTIGGYLREAANGIKDRRPNPHNIVRTTDPRKDLDGNFYSPLKELEKEYKKWEGAVNRRNACTKSMVKFLVESLPKEAGMCDLLRVFIQWLNVGMRTGTRLGEYAQLPGCKSIDDIRRNPDGTAQGFTASDVEFFGVGQKRLTFVDMLRKPSEVHAASLMWRYQKNGVKQERRTMVRDWENPDFCPVVSLIQIVARAHALAKHNKFDLATYPLAVFTDDGTYNGNLCFLNADHITDFLRTSAVHVYGLKDKKEIQKFSSHSIRVGACVALHAAGCSPMHIQHALRWKSDAFKMYLRNLPFEGKMTNEAFANYDPDKHGEGPPPEGVEVLLNIPHWDA